MTVAAARLNGFSPSPSRWANVLRDGVASGRALRRGRRVQPAQGLANVSRRPEKSSVLRVARVALWSRDDFGLHPAVVLSINVLNARLGHVAVIPVTGTRGPDQTHVPLDGDAGLTRYTESFADVTGLQPVARSWLLERRGLLATPELDRLGRRLTIYLGLRRGAGRASH